MSERNDSRGGGWGLKNHPRDADIFLPRPEGERELLVKWPDHFDSFESLVGSCVLSSVYLQSWEHEESGTGRINTV